MLLVNHLASGDQSSACLASLSLDPRIDQALAARAVVAVGVSGGKDSQAAAIAVDAHLKTIGHRGERVLIHADLGDIEWQQSLPACQKLAEHLGWELIVVRRKAGGLLERWTKRWHDNVGRYAKLECIKVIPPWSTPGMRFCTSELKTDVIASALKKRFKDQQIVSVAGIRAEESSARSRMPVAAPNNKLTRRAAAGWSWHPILTATKEEVLTAIAAQGIELHPAYTVHGMTRVSCCFCIMSSKGDLESAAQADETHSVYRALCDLEQQSTFSFQAGRWLTSIRPALLGEGAMSRFERTLKAAAAREQAESRLPGNVLYQKGWPVAIPSFDEARLIAEVRRSVADALQLEIHYTSTADVRDRIAQIYHVRNDLKVAA